MVLLVLTFGDDKYLVVLLAIIQLRVRFFLLLVLLALLVLTFGDNKYLVVLLAIIQVRGSFFIFGTFGTFGTYFW